MRSTLATQGLAGYNGPARLPSHHALGTAQAEKEGTSHADRFRPAYSCGLRPVDGA